MTVGLLLTSLALGFRHGVDWDHLAAIADLTTTAETRRRGFVLSMVYAAGHGVVVFVLGAIAVVVGASLPEGADTWMTRFVGATLLILGVWTLFDLARSGREFRLRSRWMLILTGTFAGWRRVRGNPFRRQVTVEHEHDHEHEQDGGLTHDHQQAHDHAHLEEDAELPVSVGSSGPAQFSNPRPHVHHHRHTHNLQLGDDASQPGNGTAAGVGVLHGIGFESPTQIAVFVASTSVVGAAGGLAVLLAWVVGLLAANATVALLAGFGLLHAERNFVMYAAIAIVVGVTSAVMGVLLIGGFDVLPGILID